MELVEREIPLTILNNLLAKVHDGAGQVVLVSGEAGIGKSVLIKHFTANNQSPVHILQGACDPISTPHPLAPLYDIAVQLPESNLRQAIQTSEPLPIFHTLLEILETGPLPTIVILEDIHWADEATLDLLKFLARRIHRIPCLLVALYRDDELGEGHPLWNTLGHLSAPHIRRIKLQRLSESVVAYLARQAGRSEHGLYALTNGNPFYVSEVLSSPTETIPYSIRDVVLTRLTTLSPQARNLIELASVIPRQRCAYWLLNALLNPAQSLLKECGESGLVQLLPDALVFRHDLTRIAIEESLSLLRRRELNELVLNTLVEQIDEGADVSAAHIVHHARQTDNHKLLRKYSFLAAEEARGMGAHREAASHFRAALTLSAELTAAEHASLLEQLSYECYLTGQIEDAIGYRQRALDIWREEGQALHIGESLRWLSRLYWFDLDRASAERYAAEAVDVLEQHPPGKELAMAYSNQSQLFMLAYRKPEAVMWGKRAIALAEQLGEIDSLVHALNNVGTAQMRQGIAQGKHNLEKSLRLALEHNLEEHAARAYTNLSWILLGQRRYAAALPYFDAGIEYATDRDLDSWQLYMRGGLARQKLEQGMWDEAEQEALEVVDLSYNSLLSRFVAQVLLLRLKIRRGLPGAAEELATIRSLALSAAESQRVVPFLTAQAEYVWLSGAPRDDLIPQLEAHYGQVLAINNTWAIGALGFWLWRFEALSSPHLDQMPEPYALQMSGDWQAAATTWQQIGCPYEEALALMDGDEEAQLAALGIFERLGASPAANIIRKKLNLSKDAPSQEITSAYGSLTQRQTEVLELLIEGLSDSEIGERLFISRKTAGHHVSAILGKLGVRSRQEAAILAVQEGWYTQK